MSNIPYRNLAHIAGYIGNEPQLRFLPAGDAVISLRIATQHFWKDAQGEWQSGTEWHTAVFYRQLAELCQACGFKKGDFINLEGRLHTREWQDDRGHKHASREVIGERFHRVDLSWFSNASEDVELSQESEASQVAGRQSDTCTDDLETFRKLT